MTSPRGLARSAFRPAVLACLSLLIIVSCRRQPAPPSGVQVRVTAQGVLLTTSAAAFELFPAGYLSASLLSDGRPLSLDDASPAGSSDFVVSGGKQIDDFRLNLAAAKVTEGAGRLGAKGKTVEVSGPSASIPSLRKVLTIEVADEFPAIAFASVAYRNTGSAPLPLD